VFKGLMRIIVYLNMSPWWLVYMHKRYVE